MPDTYSLKTQIEKWAYKSYTKNIYYLSVVRYLLFATQIKPDIQFAVSLIAQLGRNPGIAYLKVAKYVLYYLKGTMDFNLVLEHCKKSLFDLIG